MEFIEPFTQWSLIHFAGSFIITLTLGSLGLNISPLTSGGIVLGCGVGWEVLADQRFHHDPRGGDYYDLMWDLGGCLAGTAMLEYAEKYRRRHKPSPAEFQFHPVIPRSLHSTAWGKWYKFTGNQIGNQISSAADSSLISPQLVQTK
jgi:hypothetical protein